ncbi:intraflagellar transport 140 homolog, partial [Paramuricea clavata]
SYEDDADEAIKQCQILLEEPDIETAVRIGDVYGIMVEHLARQQNYSKAYSLMQELRQRVPSVNMSFYVNIRTIEVIHKALDIPLERGVQHKVITNGDAGGSEDEGEILDEAVEEDLQNGFD